MSAIDQEEVDTVKSMLHSITHGIRYRVNQIMQETGLTFPQAIVLKVIDKSDIPPTLAEVSDKVRLAPSTVSDIIHRLQRNGLLIREQDHLDARAIRLRITREARELLKLSGEKYDSLIRDSLGVFNVNELKLFLSLLERFSGALHVNGVDCTARKEFNNAK